MSYTDASSYVDNGFVVVPAVITKEEVKSNRDVIEEVLAGMPARKRMLFVSDIFKNDALTNLLISSQCSDKLTSILGKIFNGEFSYINDLQIQCSMFGIASGGWHFDANSEVNLQSGDYLHNVDYSFAKVGVYLQDNTFDFGGAIDVIPKSHKVFRYFGGSKFLQYFFARFASKLMRFGQRFSSISVPIKAGDAVIFDSRTLHRSSFPHAIKATLSDGEKLAERVSSHTISSINAKYSLYWEVGRQQDAESFLKNSCKRAMAEEILSSNPHQEMFYTDYLQYSFPADYPDHYKDRVNDISGLKILSLDQPKASFFKSVLK
jgi:hypothetical protein